MIEAHARAYRVPTDLPEADGTAAWDSTTLVVVHAEAEGQKGIGYSYGDASAATLVNTVLAAKVTDHDAMDPPSAWRAMQAALRNSGRPGIASTALSAVDTALWDLKAVLLGRALADVLGKFRTEVAIYGSGGFTSYTDAQLAAQLAGWVERDGCAAVKMKVGTHPEQDPARVAAAKSAIGGAQLFVDANGAYGVKQAVHMAHVFADGQDVRWFEEPVSSDDLDGLARVRGAAPPQVEVAAGEYACDAPCAPALHVHLGCAAPRFRHCEWFHDHVRLEAMLFDGAPVARAGAVAPDLSRPGLGLVFKRQDAERFAVQERGI